MSASEYTKGDLILCGNIWLNSSDIYDGRLESAFGEGARKVSFGEFTSNAPKAGIDPQKIVELIKTKSDDFLQKWLEHSGHNDCRSKTGFDDFDITFIQVDWKFVYIEFKSYCKFDIDYDIDDSNDWDDFYDEIFDAATELTGGDYLETSYNGYDVSIVIDDVNITLNK